MIWIIGKIIGGFIHSITESGVAEGAGNVLVSYLKVSGWGLLLLLTIALYVTLIAILWNVMTHMYSTIIRIIDESDKNPWHKHNQDVADYNEELRVYNDYYYKLKKLEKSYDETLTTPLSQKDRKKLKKVFGEMSDTRIYKSWYSQRHKRYSNLVIDDYRSIMEVVEDLPYMDYKTDAYTGYKCPEIHFISEEDKQIFNPRHYGKFYTNFDQMRTIWKCIAQATAIIAQMVAIALFVSFILVLFARLNTYLF
jgi:hypothetical protein